MYSPICIDAHSSDTPSLGAKKSCYSTNVTWIQGVPLSNHLADDI